MTQQEFDLLRIYDALPTAFQDLLAFMLRVAPALATKQGEKN